VCDTLWTNLLAAEGIIPGSFFLLLVLQALSVL
jgi:hypothetical protein